MGKVRRPDLSGIALSRFLRRLLNGEMDLGDAARARLLARIEADVASLRLRRHAAEDDVSNGPVDDPSSRSCTSAPPTSAPETFDPTSGTLATSAVEDPFDPFDPNVIVLVRTLGPAEARSALARIDGLDKLHRLAREQRLSVAPDITDPGLLRAAIVEAAERRIANRRAAAS